jgi:hypothetical protein
MAISPSKMLLIGLALMILGIVLPFLMVVHVLESTFFLNFFSYAASLLGLFLGIIGSASYVAQQRKKAQKDEPPIPPDAPGTKEGR